MEIGRNVRHQLPASTSYRPAPVTGHPTQPHLMLYTTTTMPRQQRSIRTAREGRLNLAIDSIQKNITSIPSRAATLYTILRTTLRRRLQDSLSKAAANAQKRKLLPTKEQSLLQWILDLDRRGSPPHIINVRRMADALLTTRGEDPPPQPIGKY